MRLLCVEERWGGNERSSVLSFGTPPQFPFISEFLQQQAFVSIRVSREGSSITVHKIGDGFSPPRSINLDGEEGALVADPIPDSVKRVAALLGSGAFMLIKAGETTYTIQT